MYLRRLHKDFFFYFFIFLYDCYTQKILSFLLICYMRYSRSQPYNIVFQQIRVRSFTMCYRVGKKYKGKGKS